MADKQITNDPTEALIAGVVRRLETVLREAGISPDKTGEITAEAMPYISDKIREAVDLGRSTATHKVIFEDIEPNPVESMEAGESLKPGGE